MGKLFQSFNSSAGWWATCPLPLSVGKKIFRLSQVTWIWGCYSWLCVRHHRGRGAGVGDVASAWPPSGTEKSLLLHLVHVLVQAMPGAGASSGCGSGAYWPRPLSDDQWCSWSSMVARTSLQAWECSSIGFLRELLDCGSWETGK